MPRYLQQATQLTSYRKDKINLIFADVGAGKTTYVGNKLPQELDYEGAFILLAPYTALRRQAIESQLFEEEGEDYGLYLNNTIFHEGKIQDFSNFKGKRVAMTTQSFFWAAQANPDIWNQVGVLIIDEIDHVLFNLPFWSNNPNDPFKTILDLLIAQAATSSTYIIGLTATQQNKILKSLGNYAWQIRFKEVLRKLPYTRKEYSEFSTVLQTALNRKGNNKIAIYHQQVRSCLKIKRQLDELGYTTRLIVSDNAKNYQMSKEEVKLKKAIEETGQGDFTDILIFNAALERGVNINHSQFTQIIVHNTREEVQVQAAGRFRYRDLGFTMYCYNNTEMPKQLPQDFFNFVGKWLGKEEINELVKLLDWRNPANNRQLKWTSLSKKLQSQGYRIETKRRIIEGKRQTQHKIHLKV